LVINIESIHDARSEKHRVHKCTRTIMNDIVCNLLPECTNNHECSRIPFIRTLVIRVANYPDRLVP